RVLFRSYVKTNLVAIAYERNRAFIDCLRRYVANTQPGGTTREAAVGEEQNIFTQPGALNCAGDREHFAHPRSALGSFIADHNHITRRNGPVFQGVQSSTFARKPAGCTFEYVRIETGRLHAGPTRRQ